MSYLSKRKLYKGSERYMKKNYNGIYNRCIKRSFDIVISGVALFILWPLYLIISGAIIIEDGFPVFYRAPRGGV